MILTVPDVPVPLMLAIFVPMMLIGPIVWYPFSKTIWVAIDRAFLNPEGLNERGGSGTSLPPGTTLLRYATWSYQRATGASADQAGGRRSTLKVRMPSSIDQVASERIAKSR